MKGKSLYEVYFEEIAKQTSGEGVPEWNELAPIERRAWDELAKFVQELIVKALGVQK